MSTLADVTTARGLRVPGRALRWEATRSGGPGGQHANTSDTRVVLELDLDRAADSLPSDVAQRLEARHGRVVRVVAADTRSQWRNRALARDRLAALVDAAARVPATRRATRPSAAAVAARRDEKRRRSERKAARTWRPGDDD